MECERGTAPDLAGLRHAGLSWEPGRLSPFVNAGEQRAVRTALSFRAVNRRDGPGYDPALQRHHLLPFQLLGTRPFGPLLSALGLKRIGFDDFRRNGLLLPASEQTARLLALPLHRGPHAAYNAMVLERVGQIEARWSRRRLAAPEAALEEALFRLGLLQGALRRRLLGPTGRRAVLNRHDPALHREAFADLDSMADLLWTETDVAA